MCGHHAHFMNQEDEQFALAVLERTLEKLAKRLGAGDGVGAQGQAHVLLPR